MANHLLLVVFCTFLFLFVTVFSSDREAYVVYMGERPKDSSAATDLHMSMLNKVVGRDAADYLLHSYKRSFNGFSAKLTKDEMQKLAKMEGVVSVFLSEKMKTHTTSSWDFMGFSKQVKRSRLESDIIVGVLDTGIWPESESFTDKGFGSPPKKWKGVCQSSFNFTCNNKIIGAKYYKGDKRFSPEDLQSPRDSDGHGTHTASTAAGNVVPMASMQGLGLGSARGGVPSARIAVYKVCWLGGCGFDDILAAYDDAIADGVDILSISLGSRVGPRDYWLDPHAIGGFHAMKKGVLTLNSAGNEGPNRETTASVAPWLLSVAASTMSRKFLTDVKLGNGEIYSGVSLNTFELKGTYPLIHGRDAPNTRSGFNGSISRYCGEGTLDRNLVKGKIVVCEGGSLGIGQLEAGAIGTLFQETFKSGIFTDVANSFPLPAAVIDKDQSFKISSYIQSSRHPIATITKSYEGKDALAPSVASFSSRGPNPISSNILKPDVSAPGVDILAAWPPITPITSSPNDNRRFSYNIISGTSMACPHVSGVAAYVKSFHPNWSPAAIKSAIMTTAFPMSSKTSPDAEFGYGSGHLNPIKAINPGLIYDANEIEYVRFLCGQGFDANHLKIVTGDNSSCSTRSSDDDTAWDMNYPSFVLPTFRQKPFVQIINRTVTNVGSSNSTYQAIVRIPTEIPSTFSLSINVVPRVLRFTSVGQKLSFAVTVQGVIRRFADPIVSASLIWDDGLHQVRSPIVIHVPF